MNSLLRKLLQPFRQARLRKALAAYRSQSDSARTTRLALALSALGRTDEAYSLMARGRKHFPQDAEFARNVEAIRGCHAKSLLAKAASALRFDKSPESHVRAADLYRAVGQFDLGLSVVSTARSVFQDHWAVELAAGQLHLARFDARRSKDDLESGLGCLNRARQLNPGSYKCSFILALASLRAGRLDEAQALIGAILAKSPADKRTLALSARLVALRAAAGARAGAARAVAQPTRAARAAPAEPGAESPAQVVERLAACPESLGVFAFDARGALIGRSARPNAVFDFTNCEDSVRAMADGCKSGGAKIGLGAFESCVVSGDGWNVVVRARSDMNLVSFLEGNVVPSAFEESPELLAVGQAR